MSQPNADVRVRSRPSYTERSAAWREDVERGRVTPKRINVRGMMYDRPSGEMISAGHFLGYPSYVVAYKLDGTDEWVTTTYGQPK